VNANIAKWPSAKSYDTKTIAKAQEFMELFELLGMCLNFFFYNQTLVFSRNFVFRTFSIEIIETTRNPHEGVGVKGDIPYQHAGVSVFGLMLRVGRRHICFSIHIHIHTVTHILYTSTHAQRVVKPECSNEHKVASFAYS
jgi:hypothetical protein